jgi:glutamate carboxypeptidase
MNGDNLALDARERAVRMIDAYLGDLEALVNIDSGTYTKAGVDAVGRYLRSRFEAAGCSVTMFPEAEYGDNLVATLHGSGPGRLMLVGHMDTVFPDGEAQRRPFTCSNGRAAGPGILDMKSGLLVGLYALLVLREQGFTDFGTITMVCNSDEEIGSPGSRPLIRDVAGQSDAVFVLEPGLANGQLVTARKGVATYRLEVRGVAAHAGVDPKKGRSAILELAHQIQALHALNGTIPGVTVNVGVIGGGERPNVVPDYAYAQIDLRAADMAGVTAVQEELVRIARQTTVPETTVTLEGTFFHLPFEKSVRSARLVALAQEVGRELGLELEEVTSGGGSDGNTTAAMGVATLDGLGLSGALAHNPGEYIEIGSIAPRIALVAQLLRRTAAACAAGDLA